eukprot:CAMPEP_0182449128 /NCGR_PEP_ID=MMETSP1172-20130603/31916_1 /TAXON_ID=708627 /ORGANISM="Timspurckia oligopyrenoides, Strain CCMP3278" /LENGTH=280 /DNA_ID=CAMNT_0024646257 /DNA_START=146 /DNA_END=988 /DNA_ORIENTATION=+
MHLPYADHNLKPTEQGSIPDYSSHKYLGIAQKINGILSFYVKDIDKVLDCFVSQQYPYKAHENPVFIETFCPNSNKIRLFQAPLEIQRLYRNAGGFPGEFDIRNNAESSRTCGIKEVRMFCAKGTAKGIARFYQNTFGIQSISIETSSMDNSLFSAVIPVSDVVPQYLIYEEDPQIDKEYECSLEKKESALEYYEKNVREHGYHICVYVRNYSAVKSKCKELDSIWHSDRFQTLDQYTTETQFRMLLITDPDQPQSNRILHVLEHEIRSLDAPQCPLKVQ